MQVFVTGQAQSYWQLALGTREECEDKEQLKEGLAVPKQPFLQPSIFISCFFFFFS